MESSLKQKYLTYVTNMCYSARHELSRAVIERPFGFGGFVLSNKAGSESAALWESFADVMSITIKHHATQTMTSWSIGENIHCDEPRPGARALRDMSAPGTAFDFVDKEGKHHIESCIDHVTREVPGMNKYTTSMISSLAFYKITVASGRPT